MQKKEKDLFLLVDIFGKGPVLVLAGESGVRAGCLGSGSFGLPVLRWAVSLRSLVDMRRKERHGLTDTAVGSKPGGG